MYSSVLLLGASFIASSSCLYLPDLTEPSAHNKRGSSITTVPLTLDPVNLMYTVPVQIGGQTTNLLFDTGSNDLWVVSDLTAPNPRGTCPTPINTKKLNLGTPSSDNSNDITYIGSGISGGSTYSQDVSVGGIKASQLDVGFPTSINFAGPVCGTLGMGLGATSAKQSFENNIEHLLHQPLFTVTMTGDSGTVELGALNTQNTIGEIATIPLQSTTMSFFTILRANLNTNSNVKTSISFPAPQNQGILDTGNPSMYLPQPVIDALYQQLNTLNPSHAPIQQNVDIPCNLVFPDFSLDLQSSSGSGTYTAVIKGAEMLPPSMKVPGKMCVPPFRAGGSPYNIGASFMRSQVVGFERVKGLVFLGNRFQ